MKALQGAFHVGRPSASLLKSHRCAKAGGRAGHTVTYVMPAPAAERRWGFFSRLTTKALLAEDLLLYPFCKVYLIWLWRFARSSHGSIRRSPRGWKGTWVVAPQPSQITSYIWRSPRLGFWLLRRALRNRGNGWARSGIPCQQRIAVRKRRKRTRRHSPGR